MGPTYGPCPTQQFHGMEQQLNTQSLTHIKGQKMPKFPINLGSYTTQELCDLNEQVVALIKTRRRQEATKKRHQLSLGDVVNVEGHGKGTVKKIMRTRALVEMNGSTYKVPMSILS